MSTQEQIAAKQRELEALKKITQLTETMNEQLEELNKQVHGIEENGASVAQIMSTWDSVTQSISAAGLGLLRYGEENYKVGAWDESKDTANKGPKKDMALPEGLVRVNVDELKSDRDS